MMKNHAVCALFAGFIYEKKHEKFATFFLLFFVFRCVIFTSVDRLIDLLTQSGLKLIALNLNELEVQPATQRLSSAWYRSTWQLHTASTTLWIKENEA